jgi:putative Holliday junction resolvase
MARVLGIDFGLKKIGLALVETESQLATPLKIIKVRDNHSLVISKIKDLCQKEEIKQIVVGLPESGLVGQIKNFGEKLHQATDLLVFYQTETLTTKDVLAKMKEAGIRGKARRKKEDALAAVLILENWLNKTNV